MSAEGQFEGLRDAVRKDAARRPDVGGPDLHPTAGASAVGARKFLIAYNIYLESNDVAAARAIAREIRASSGGLLGVKAMGVLAHGHGADLDEHHRLHSDPGFAGVCRGEAACGAAPLASRSWRADRTDSRGGF